MKQYRIIIECKGRWEITFTSRKTGSRFKGQLIRVLWKQGPSTVQDIQTGLAELKYKRSPTTNQIANLLRGNHFFSKQGTEKLVCNDGGTYVAAIWKLNKRKLDSINLLTQG